MATLNPLYNLPTDDLSPSATITVPTGTPDPTYGVVANLTNGQPGLPFKFTTTFGSFLFVFGSSVLPLLPILRHTNLDPSTGTAVLQGSPDGITWDAAISFTLNSADPDGFRNDPWINVGAVAPTQVARTHWRIVFANNPENIIVGGTWLGSILRSFTHAPSKGIQPGTTGAQLMTETAEGVQAGYDLGTRWDEPVFTVITSKTVGLAAINTLFLSARRIVIQWPIILDATVNRALFVRFTTPVLGVKGLAANACSIDFKLREVSKGQAWS